MPLLHFRVFLLCCPNSSGAARHMLIIKVFIDSTSDNYCHVRRCGIHDIVRRYNAGRLCPVSQSATGTQTYSQMTSNLCQIIIMTTLWHNMNKQSPFATKFHPVSLHMMHPALTILSSILVCDFDRYMYRPLPRL